MIQETKDQDTPDEFIHLADACAPPKIAALAEFASQQAANDVWV